MTLDGLPSRVTLASADDTHTFGIRLGRLLVELLPDEPEAAAIT